MATYRRNKGGITSHLLSRFFIQFQIASGGRKAGKERGIFARSKGEREEIFRQAQDDGDRRTANTLEQRHRKEATKGESGSLPERTSSNYVIV
mgnify:FL=1